MSWSKGILLVFLFLPASWTRVSRLNDAIDAASVSYAETKYAESIKAHRLLVDEFQLASPSLDFDLGLSYQYGEQPEEALSFYDKAAQTSDKLLASFAYNQSGVLIGNKKEYDAALSKFQTALIKNPNNAEARHNYELLARWMKRDEERKQQEENTPEPSEFAKRKKAEADRLVEQFKFKDALTLMEDALTQDPSVAAYKEFVQTLKDVVEINEN
jgi:tetratricopeptide (TPR) repeat protein